MSASILRECLLVISMPGPLELLLILLVVLLLFGARRLPEVAKGLGEAIREFKKSISGHDGEPRDPGPKAS